MKYSSLTERIAGESVDAWDVHYEGLARLEAGEDIIVLSVGQETEEVTDGRIVNAAITSLNAGRHHYTPVNGNLDLRQAIAKRHTELTGQVVDESHCAVFAGAQNALFSVAQVLLEAGDEVILIEPFYTTYPATFSASGATLVPVAVKAENEFQIDVSDIRAAITERTRAIVINSPNNPIGAIYQREQYEALVALCVDKQIWLINDEVYQEIIAPEERHSPASIAGADEVCITVSSLSKSHRMTGWRLGWAVGPPAIMQHLYNLCMCMAYGLPQFIMDAAVEAFASGTGTADEVRQAMDRRRKILVNTLDGIDGMDVFSAAGGMYVVLNIRSLPVDGQSFARGLLKKHNVTVLPCDGFGETGRGLLRVSLCASDQNLEVACQRIASYVPWVLDQGSKGLNAFLEG